MAPGSSCASWHWRASRRWREHRTASARSARDRPAPHPSVADLFDKARRDAARSTFEPPAYHPGSWWQQAVATRVWDPALTKDPWGWLEDQVASAGAAANGSPWPIDPADAGEVRGLAGEVVSLARRFSPVRCGSQADCYRLTRDVRTAVQLMAGYLQQPELLDEAWVSPWLAAS
jgi:hypothetical protein